MEHAEHIDVEVVVATPDRQELVGMRFRRGASAADAVARSGISGKFPQLNLDECQLAVWGKLAAPDTVLRSGDRVEVLRPLAIDPRDTRRELAKEGQVMGGAVPESD